MSTLDAAAAHAACAVIQRPAINMVKCGLFQGQYVVTTAGVGSREVFCPAKADEILIATEITGDVAAEVIACANADYDYGDFSENFWNAWGNGYPHCQKLGNDIRDRADTTVANGEEHVYYCDRQVIDNRPDWKPHHTDARSSWTGQ